HRSQPRETRGRVSLIVVALRSRVATTAVALGKRAACPRDAKGRRSGRPSRVESLKRVLAAANRTLERAAGRELRHRRRGDLDLLARARVDAGARRALGRRELAEAGEVHRIASLEGIRDCLQKSVHGLRSIAIRQAGLRRHLLDEVILGHNPLLLSRTTISWSRRTLTGSSAFRITMRFCGGFTSWPSPSGRSLLPETVTEAGRHG